MVVQRVVRVTWQEVNDLALTAREAGGFGHTDQKK
jgi:dUTPase